MTPAAPPFHDWVTSQRDSNPDAAETNDLIEVTAVALYRALWLMECGGRPAERKQAAASLRQWLDLT